MISKIMKSYPLQVLRHRVYLSWLSVLDYFGDFKRQNKIKTQVWNHFVLYQEKAFIYSIPAKSKN